MKFLSICMTGFCIILFFIGQVALTAAEKGETMNMAQKIDYRIISDDFNIMIYAADKKLLLYKQAKNAFKPYVKELNTPAGNNVLLDSPDDHKHHHGLMFACKVDGINFWEETDKSGFQVSGDYREVSTIEDDGGFVVNVSWMDADKNQIMLSEIRSIKAKSLPALNANLFTWQSIFTGPESKSSVNLSGAHYNGLGIRFVRSMDNNGRFFTAENKSGEIFRGDERLIPDRWCAYTSQVGEKKVTIAMFNAPENQRSPATWFTMKETFAYMAATMRLHEDTFSLEQGDVLALKYGIALWDGHIDPEQIEEVYQFWIKIL
jgi:hypothetical protein